MDDPIISVQLVKPAKGHPHEHKISTCIKTLLSLFLSGKSISGLPILQKIEPHKSEIEYNIYIDPTYGCNDILDPTSIGVYLPTKWQLNC